MKVKVKAKVEVEVEAKVKARVTSRQFPVRRSEPERKDNRR